LGRPQGRDGNAGTADANQKVEDIARQAEEVLNEIRRRAGDVDRPQSELNYLRRLLELF
jgi:peptidoglycan hydrolase CwlO-like protein